jgi:microcystin-dependent protein
MGLETGTYIDDLNSSNPVAGDPVNEGDDHIRLLKSTIKASFPSVTGAVSATHTELNLIDGVTATTTELNYVDITTLGTAQASKAVTADANVDVTGLRNLTISGTMTVGSNTVTTLQAVYPVGSIYINAAVTTNPGTLLGFGTWTAFGTGRVIVGYDASDGDFDALQETGGAKTVTLSTSQIPSHTHNIVTYNETGSPDGSVGGDSSSSTIGSQNTAATGGGAAHANVQPYIVAYMWRRTA